LTSIAVAEYALDSTLAFEPYGASVWPSRELH
jgi:hypothetical protein